MRPRATLPTRMLALVLLAAGCDERAVTVAVVLEEPSERLCLEAFGAGRRVHRQGWSQAGRAPMSGRLTLVAGDEVDETVRVTVRGFDGGRIVASATGESRFGPAADPPALLLHARRCARRARRTEYPVVRDWLAVSNVAADARLLAIDADGDGDDEVLVSGAGGGTVVLGEGRLPRNFDAGVPDARATVAFDADGDCALDLAGLSPEGGFVRVASGTEDVRRVGLGARSLAVGDLLGDGRVSVALATPSAVIIVAVDAPTDVHSLRVDDATHVEVTDLDGDLQADLLVSSASGTSAWRASGGTFVAHAATFPQAIAEARGPVAFGDLDADGQVDVVVADARLVRVARSVGAMGYVEASVVTLSRPAIHLRVGDVDGDCQDDVVAVDEGGTLALFRAGAGATLTRVLLSLGLAVDAVFADVDGDGPRELVVLERSGAVRVVGS